MALSESAQTCSAKVLSPCHRRDGLVEVGDVGRLGRHWIGIEREPGYVEIARDRIASTLPLDESAMRTVPDKREQPRVAFGVLVESGLVPPGTKVVDVKKRWTAAVRADVQ